VVTDEEKEAEKEAAKAADLRQEVRQQLRLLIGEASAFAGTLAEHPCPLGLEWLDDAHHRLQIVVSMLEQLHDAALASAPPDVTSLGVAARRRQVRPRLVRGA
jgi:hypothetical protein